MTLSFFNKLKNSFTEIQAVKIASTTFIIMLVPVLVFIGVLEILIPKSSIVPNVKSNDIISNVEDIKTYILYLASGSAHIIISSAILIYFRNKLYKDSSKFMRKIFRTGIFVMATVMTLIFLLFDGININLALLSHERLYEVLLESTYFSNYFVSFLDFNTSWSGIYVFSIMPFTLIFVGLLVIVYTCMNIGKDLSEVFKKIHINIKLEERKELLKGIEAFHKYLYVLSFVLVTSTIATLLYLQIPLVCIKDGEFYNSFKETSIGLGICWGVIFSLTMFAMCFYPFFIIQKKIKHLCVNSNVAENKELNQWFIELQNNYLVYKNLKTLLTVLSPTIISLLGHFV